MTGIYILRHSIQMVLRNFLVIVKLGLVPFVGLSCWFVLFIALTVAGTKQSPLVVGFVPITFFLVLFVALMFAVNWHRFVLLEEYPRSWIPSVHTGRMLHYFGTGLAMALLCCLVVLPVLLLQVFVLSNGSLIGAMVGLTAIMLVSLYMFYRAAVMLPASAIGKPLKISEAFAATRKASGNIIVLVVANTVLQFVFSQGGSVLIWAGFPILGSVWSAAVSIILPVLNLSILTTVYGHYVEGRPISD